MARSMLGWMLVLGLIMVGGCGDTAPTTVPVTGTVTYNNNPVEGATVRFLAEGSSHMASGTTDANGKFTLTLNMGEEKVEGAQIGVNEVSVVKFEGGGEAPAADSSKEATLKMSQGAPAMTSDFESKNLLPERYASPVTSQLKYTVEAGKTNDFKIELKD
jgi:hypothetical protein